MRSKSGKLFEIGDIEEKLKKIERNERKLETLFFRVDHLENLSSRYNNNNNSELQNVITVQPVYVGNGQEQLVNAF